MPRRCNACRSPDAGELAKAIAEGGSNSALADRFKLSESSIQRHRVGCLRAPRKAKDQGALRDESVAAGVRRFDMMPIEGRCATCGLSMTETDAQSLLRRAERILWIAETIAAQAQRDDDSRLALQAVDRARSSLETMMRATGLIGGDASVTVQVDARRQVMANLGRLSIDELRALATGEPDKTVGRGDAELQSVTDNR